MHDDDDDDAPDTEREPDTIISSAPPLSDRMGIWITDLDGVSHLVEAICDEDAG